MVFRYSTDRRDRRESQTLIGLSVYLPFSICLSAFQSVRQTVCLSANLSLSLSLFLSLSLARARARSLCLSVCLSVCHSKSQVLYLHNTIPAARATPQEWHALQSKQHYYSLSLSLSLSYNTHQFSIVSRPLPNRNGIVLETHKSARGDFLGAEPQGLQGGLQHRAKGLVP